MICKNKQKLLYQNGSGNKGTAQAANQMAGDLVGIGQLLTLIGAGALVAAITYLGIMYMISAPDKQAQLKIQLIGVAAGGIVVFGALAIWNFGISIFSVLG